MKYDVLYNFISPVTGKLSTPPDLPKLSHNYVWLGDTLNVATPTDVATVTPLLSLTKGYLLTGDTTNHASEIPYISLSNLPNLGVAVIPGDVLPLGRIWRGTASNRPEESDSLSEAIIDIGLINTRFLSSKFILNSGFPYLRRAMPNAQYLEDLAPGGITTVSNTGILSIATSDNILNSINLLENYIFIGNAQNKPTEIAVLPISNLTRLTHNYIWQGDDTNRPIEVQLNYAPTNSTYILQTPDNNLVNSQSLSVSLPAGGILKSTAATGVINMAIVGVDYPSVASVTAAQSTADTALIDAAAAPAAGAALAATYFTAQMFPYLPVPSPLGQGSQISVLIGLASAAAAAASVSANNANTRIDNLNINLNGDINASGNINTVVKTTFSPNPVFTGSTLTLPSDDKNSIKLVVGMLRCNLNPNN